MATTPVPSININVLNYNKVKVAEKQAAEAQTRNPVSHIKYLNKKYATNGSQQDIETILEIMLEEAEENEVVQPLGRDGGKVLRLEDAKGKEIEYTYYTHDATETAPGKILGVFVDYAANEKLMNSKNYDAFKLWFNGVVTAFFLSKGFTVQSMLNIPDTGDKFHFDYPIKVVTAGT